MANMSMLTTFNLYQISGSKGPKRQVAIDPRKVVAIRETVTGSVVIAYPGKQTFEVSEPHKSVVDKINRGRALL